MKRYILGGILWLGFLTQLPAQHILSLTQADCRELALLRNEELQKATNALQQAELDQKIAFSSYLPKFDGMVSGSYMFPDVEMTGMELQIHGMYLAGISMTQPLYAGGKIRAGNKLAQIGRESAAESRRKTRMEVIAEADKAYWNYIAVQQRYVCWKRIAHKWIPYTNR